MKTKRIIYFLLCILLISAVFPITASSDTGPKPSVQITFENMGDDLCYGTLLSEEPSTGPYSAWNGEENTFDYSEWYEYNGISEEVYMAFSEYQDSDGYYFLQRAIWQVNEQKTLAWRYYPPQKFKVLLYYPSTDTFAVSNIYERYAFDSYYTLDISNTTIDSANDSETASNNKLPTAYKSYNWKQEILSLVARIIITIAIEMCIAFLFRFRGKKALLLLVVVNTTTQLILNVLLNLVNFRLGALAFVAAYIAFELAVFAIEAMIYSVTMKKLTDKAKPTWFYIVYALVANAVSFGAGLCIAMLLPGIF